MDLLKQLSPRMTPSPLVLWQSQGQLQTRTAADCTVVHTQQSQQGGGLHCQQYLLAGITGGHALVILERVVSETFHRSTCQCNL